MTMLTVQFPAHKVGYTADMAWQHCSLSGRQLHLTASSASRMSSYSCRMHASDAQTLHRPLYVRLLEFDTAAVQIGLSADCICPAVQSDACEYDRTRNANPAEQWHCN